MTHIVTIPLSLDAMKALWALRTESDSSASETILRMAKSEHWRKPDVHQQTYSKPELGKFAYEILGESRRARSAIDAYIDILTTLAELEPSLPRELSQKVKGSSRNHIARDPADVYPRRPDLARTARQIAPGWWAGTNIADRDKRRILCIAYGILRIEIGANIVFGRTGADIDLP